MKSPDVLDDRPDMPDIQSHWEKVHAAKTPDALSWYQEEPRVSLDLIRATGFGETARVIDVGAGASTLVDHLLEAGYGDLAVLDISERALALARERLGEAAERVQWLVADVTQLAPRKTWDVWHDRAVFHFLTAREDREAYMRVLARALAPGGQAIIATFAPTGPESCSGLPTMRYSPAGLAAELGPGFRLLEHRPEAHATPGGARQDFVYGRFERVAQRVPSVDTDFSNVYDDETRAEAYARLEFPGTYWLAYRDLPAILREHAAGTRALDFGCGAGRSTRFLRGLGFDVTGVDISEAMLVRARARDPEGDYRLVDDRDLDALEDEAFDVIVSVFTFDNVPSVERKVALFHALGRLLKDGGRIVNLVSAPEIYLNEWASFSTKDFPENRTARAGDRVQIVMLDVDDRRPVEDILFTDEAYRDVYAGAGLSVIEMYRPLGGAADGHRWLSETTISPWTIYVLEAAR